MWFQRMLITGGSGIDGVDPMMVIIMMVRSHFTCSESPIRKSNKGAHPSEPFWKAALDFQLRAPRLRCLIFAVLRKRELSLHGL